MIGPHDSDYTSTFLALASLTPAPYLTAQLQDPQLVSAPTLLRSRVHPQRLHIVHRGAP